MREDKLVAKNERIAALVAEIEVAKQRAMQESDADRPLTLATCRLLPIDIIDIYIYIYIEREREDTSAFQ